MWTAPAAVGSLFTLSGRIYGVYADGALFEFREGAFQRFGAGGVVLPRVFAARPTGVHGEAILLTAAGPLRWAGPAAAPGPLSPDSAAAFAGAAPQAALCGAFLPDGGMALGTAGNGLWIFETDGRVRLHLGKSDGLTVLGYGCMNIRA